MQEDIRERITSSLNPMLMKWITKEGKDMFNLQANAIDISKGIRDEFDMDTSKIGISITAFNIESFNYPESVKRMQEKAASQSMVGDMNRYTQMAMVDSMANGGGNGGGNGMANMATQMHDDGTADGKHYAEFHEHGRHGLPEPADAKSGNVWSESADGTAAGSRRSDSEVLSELRYRNQWCQVLL